MLRWWLKSECDCQNPVNRILLSAPYTIQLKENSYEQCGNGGGRPEGDRCGDTALSGRRGLREQRDDEACLSRRGDDLRVHGAGPFGGPIQGLYDWHDQNGAASELQSRIANVDVEGTVATARLELDNWTGHRFTDMFTLLKTDGQWQIVNKVFYLHPEA